jgi:DNA-binding XRE family transcriptional regulator
MTMQKQIAYTGTGFEVILENFPTYEDDGEVLPDVGPSRLHRVIAYELLSRSVFLTGSDVAFLRAHADLTRSECARRMDITRRTLITWENARKRKIPAKPLRHVWLKAFFAQLLFPNWRLPQAALQPPTAMSKQRLLIDFQRFRNTLRPPGDGLVTEPLDAHFFLRGTELAA